MISDVLSEAIEQINEYQESSPDSYDGIKDEIDKVKLVMFALQFFLDLPPVEPYHEPMRKIIESIRSLDVSQIEGLLKRKCAG